MGAVKLDGAGTQKMKTIEEAQRTLQTIHGMVERMAIEIKAKKPIGTMPNAIKRIAVPLQGQLKVQFGPIGDLVAAMILSTSRGGGDQAKLRAMREYIGQIRFSLDIAANKVKEQHAVAIELSPD